MKTLLSDSKGNILDLSDLTDPFTKNYFPKLDLPPIQTQIKLLDRFGVDGSFETGDQTLKAREISCSVYIVTNVSSGTDIQRDIKFRRIYNQLGAFFKPDRRPFYIEDVDNGLRAKVSYAGLSGKYIKEGLEMRLAECQIKFTMVEGFFEGTVVTQTELGVLDGGTFVVAVNDADLIEVYNAYPIIKFTALAGNPDFTLTNQTTSDFIRLQELSFTTGDEITANSEDGSIMLGAVVKPLIKTDGNFIKLQGGNNTLQYQGAGSVDIEIKYRRRYLL